MLLAKVKLRVAGSPREVLVNMHVRLVACTDPGLSAFSAILRNPSTTTVQRSQQEVVTDQKLAGVQPGTGL
jgi:hypothetical protein